LPFKSPSTSVAGMGPATRKSILLIRDSVIVPRSIGLLVSLLQVSDPCSGICMTSLPVIGPQYAFLRVITYALDWTS
jgi:hypothetical protein